MENCLCGVESEKNGISLKTKTTYKASYRAHGIDFIRSMIKYHPNSHLCSNARVIRFFINLNDSADLKSFCRTNSWIFTREKIRFGIKRDVVNTVNNAGQESTRQKSA